MTPPPDALTAAEAALVGQAGFATPSAVEALSGGANNRVFLLRCGDKSLVQKNLVLKRYFSSAADQRDRFGAERAFYTHAAATAPGLTPQPLGWSEEARAALFEAVEGRKLAATEIDATRVNEAAAFIARLNTGTTPPLPPASEACLTLADHRATIQRRIDRLGTITPETPTHEEAIRLVADKILPRWHALESAFQSAPADAIVPIASPSDFGFHNALLPPGGTLRFLDFEYAGLDDPAKLACDFFCQPEIPTPTEHRPLFVETLAAALPPATRDAFRSRVTLFLPAYALKWCCLLLNEFLPDQAARRAFSLAEVDPETRRRAQLEKASRALRTENLS